MTSRPAFAAGLVAAVVFMSAALPLGAAEVIGKITYLQGAVQLMRGEDILEARLVKEGLALENFDVLVTGADGEIEALLSYPRAPEATLRVAPRSRLSLEIGMAAAKQQTTVGLMIGGIALKCAKLAGSQSVRVQTETALMGVRGTSFNVTAVASGDLLVDCDEGEVACTDEDGNTLSASPGEAIEKLSGEGLRRLPVAVSGLEQFRRGWNTERISALRANAGKAIPAFAVRYRSLLAQFNRDFAALLKAAKTIDKWRAEDRAGRIGGATEVAREKKEVIGSLFRLRRTLFILERVYVRLIELKEYHDEGLGRATIRYGLVSETTTQFFERFERDRPDLERKIAKVRLVARLYAQRNEGRLPSGGFGDEEEEGSFFDE